MNTPFKRSYSPTTHHLGSASTQLVIGAAALVLALSLSLARAFELEPQATKADPTAGTGDSRPRTNSWFRSRCCRPTTCWSRPGSTTRGRIA